MIGLINKPSKDEKPIWSKLSRLGIEPGKDFDFGSLPADIQKALRNGVKEGIDAIEKLIRENGNDPLGSAKIFGTREFLMESARKHFGHEDHYLIRAGAAHAGIYGNSAEEAVYPTYFVDSQSNPLDGAHSSYTLKFKKGQLPPVKSFWSLTMYDGKTQLFVRNPLN